MSDPNLPPLRPVISRDDAERERKLNKLKAEIRANAIAVRKINQGDKTTVTGTPVVVVPEHEHDLNDHIVASGARVFDADQSMADNKLTNVESVIFNTTPSITPVEGEMNYNTTDKVVEFQTDTDTRIQIGTESVFRVINKTGGLLENGSVVYIDGADIAADRATVTKADATTWEDSQRTIGLMTSDVADDAEGYVTLLGLVRDLNTDGMTQGDIVYLSETIGEWSTTRPIAPAFIIELGRIHKVDASDGEILVKVANNDDFGFFNGSFLESFDLTVDATGGVNIIASLERTGGGDLTLRFSDGFTTFDCTDPLQTITLTPGTAEVPQANYLYILKSDKTQITKSLTGFPTAVEYIKVAKVVVLTAAITETDDPLANQNINDHAADGIPLGHNIHLGEWIRAQPATYEPPGIDGNSVTGDDYLNIVTTTAYFVAQAGSIRQLHLQTYPAINTETGDIMYVVNDPDAAYTRITDLVAGIDKLSTGANWSNNKYAGFVFWGIVNKTGEGQQIMCNLPLGEYTSQAGAENDINGYTNINIPDEFKSTGFLICKLVLQKKATTIEYKSTLDLRRPSFLISGVSGGGAITSFPTNTFDLHSPLDPTKRILFDAESIAGATDRTATMPDKDLTFIDTADAITAVEGAELTLTEQLTLNTAAANLNQFVIDRTDDDNFNGFFVGSTGSGVAFEDTHRWGVFAQPVANKGTTTNVDEMLRVNATAIYNQKDNSGFYTGIGDDVRLYHDGTNSILVNATGRHQIINNANDHVDISSKRGVFIFIDSDGNTATEKFEIFKDDVPGGGSAVSLFRVEENGNVTIPAGSLIMDGSGTDDEALQLPYLTAAPSTLANGMLWMESDGLHIYYAGAEKLVAGV